jgi:phosphate starvation-inducible membrane PsiE
MINPNKHNLSKPLSRDEEYKAISKDLHTVLWLNLIYLALILIVFFTDAKYHYLMRIFAKV